ncbi:MAG TPA: acetylxylan esterase [Opitutus sp.]|nr:acetylxylan esterase [Opitutus sp.]
MPAKIPDPRSTVASSPLRELDDYVFGYAHAGSQLKDHIYERSRRLFAAGDAQRDTLASAAAVREHQAKLRAALLASIGGLPPADTPLAPRVAGVVQAGGCAIEKVIFQSRPHHYVTANLYLPPNRAARTPAILFLCGHLTPAKASPEYQAVCQTLAAAGLIVLAMDPIGQGERFSYYDPARREATVPPGTCEHDTAGAQCRLLGDSIARYFLHDAMRAVDYLVSRPEVDAARIGVTGNSGGGTQTSLLMMADPRLAAAAPGTFIMTRDSYQRTGQPQDAEQIWPGFTRAGFDHEDILIAMAPKPVCVLAVTADFFPIEGTRRTVRRAQRVWSLFDSPGRLEWVEDESTHAYTAKLAGAAAKFFSRHLLGREAGLDAFRPTPLSPEMLDCTASGQVRAEFADAEFVFEANRARTREALTARRGLAAEIRRQRAHEWLRGEVHRDREFVASNPRVIECGRRVGPFVVDVAYWWSQPQLANLGFLFRAPGARDSLPVTLAIWDHGTAAVSAHADWIEAECAAGRAALVVDLCGAGPLRPDAINGGAMDEFYGTWHKLADDLEWIGDSLVALRTFEVLRAIDAISVWPSLTADGLAVYGSGRLGVHARLAAAVEPRIARCAWDESFRFGDFAEARRYETRGIKTLILPGALRHFELDEL